MATYFVFSDESGEYLERSRTPRHKYFVRSALLFNSVNWTELKNAVDNLKAGAGIPAYREFKWCYISPIKSYQKYSHKLRKTRDWHSYKDYDIGTLIKFVCENILLFHKYQDSKVIYTFTENKPWTILTAGGKITGLETKNPTTHNIYKWHLQELMQRVKMEMQSGDNLAVLFFDQDNKKTELHLRNSYHDMYHTGDFIKEYKHIKDSLCFEHSHQSTGIQIADYIAGIFNAFLNDDEISYDLMKNCILPILRKSPSGDYLGYGIREVPRDENRRQSLRQKIKEKLVDGQSPI